MKFYIFMTTDIHDYDVFEIFDSTLFLGQSVTDVNGTSMYIQCSKSGIIDETSLDDLSNLPAYANAADQIREEISKMDLSQFKTKTANVEVSFKPYPKEMTNILQELVFKPRAEGVRPEEQVLDIIIKIIKKNMEVFLGDRIIFNKKRRKIINFLKYI